MKNVEAHLLSLPENYSADNWFDKIEYLYAQQLENWQMARNHYQQFGSIKKRSIEFNNFRIEIQHNPARARSTCANLNKEAIKKRPCFLCASNLDEEQKGFSLLNKYLLLINPFPIFERHLTISDFTHTPQNIKNRILDILSIAKELSDYTIFYNGPRCGASAPDHFHFQAAKKGIMPIDNEIKSLILNNGKILLNNENIKISQINNYVRSVIIFESAYREPIDYFVSKAFEQLPFDIESGEPMMNILANYEDKIFRLFIFPRSAQRPSCYFKNDPDRILVSPASVELGGIVITPREEDFHKIKSSNLIEIFNEVNKPYNFIF